MPWLGMSGNIITRQAHDRAVFGKSLRTVVTRLELKGDSMRKRRLNFNAAPVVPDTEYLAIAELPMSVRTINQIEKQANLVYLHQILPLTRDQIKELLPETGDRIVDELVKALQKVNMEVPATWQRIKKRVRNKT
jgi:hypothetical protein